MLQTGSTTLRSPRVVLRLLALSSTVVAILLMLFVSAASVAVAQGDDDSAVGVVVTQQSDAAGGVGPSQPVAFTVTVDNRSGQALNDVILTVGVEGSAFASFEALDSAAGSSPPEVLEGGLRWRIGLIEDGLTATRRYRATTAERLDVDEARTTASVETTTDVGSIAAAETVIGFTNPFRSISLTHTVGEDNTVISPTEEVTFAVTLGSTEPVEGPVRLRFQPDENVFVSGETVVTPPTSGDWDGSGLVWEVESIGSGQTNEFTYTAKAEDEFDGDALLLKNQIFVEIGAASQRLEVTAPLASPSESIAITHVRQDPSSPVGPGSVVPFVVIVANNSDRSEVEDIEVSVQQPEGDLVQSLTGIDPKPTTLDADDEAAVKWRIASLGFGDERRFVYEVQLSGTSDEPSLAPLTADVGFLGGSRRASTKPVEMAVGAAALTINHAPVLDVRLEPGATVTYEVQLENPGAVDIDGISVRIEAADVFSEVEAVDGSPEGECENGLWCLDVAAGTSATLTYRASAIDKFGDATDPAVNAAVVEVHSDGRPERANSEALPLLVIPVVADNEPTLEATPTFILTVAYMLLSFVAVSVMVMSRRSRTMAGDAGRNLFTIISLVSATLILAFGTNLQSEGIGLLAAIAGYVLGRGVTEREERRAEEAEAQALLAGAPGPGEAGAVGAVGIPLPSQTGAVASAVGELRRLSRERRLAPLFVLSTSLLSPVMIVLASLWLLDSLADVEVPAMTYYSAGTIVLLLLLFLGGLTYVVSDDDGDAHTSSFDEALAGESAGEVGADGSENGNEAET